MKINLKFKAMSVLMSGLHDTQKWVIYQMASGKDLPDSVTKVDLIKIIAFLFKYLDWIEGTEDSIELECASNVDTQENNVTQDTRNESTKPMTSKSSGGDHHTISSSEVGAVNPAALNTKENEETESQHLGFEPDLDSALDSMEHGSPSNNEMEVQNDTTGNQEQQKNSSTESTISNINKEHQGGKEGEYQCPEMDMDKAIDGEAKSAAPPKDKNIGMDSEISFN